MSYAGADGKGAMSMGVGLTIVLTLFVDAGTVTADFNRWAKDLEGSLDLDFQRLSVRQSGRDAGRRHHDGGAGRAERQSVRRRQHVRLHERQAARLAVGARLHLPVLQSGFGLRPLPLQCGDRLVAHLGQPHAASRRGARASSASSSPPAMCGPSSSSGSRCSASWCRRSAPSSSSINFCCGRDFGSEQRMAPARLHRLGRRFGGWRTLSASIAPEYSTAIAAFIVAGVVYGVLPSVMATKRYAGLASLMQGGGRETAADAAYGPDL